jgi:hypothetical protein
MAAIDSLESFVFVLAKYFVSPGKFSHENNALIFLFPLPELQFFSAGKGKQFLFC